MLFVIKYLLNKQIQHCGYEKSMNFTRLAEFCDLDH